MDGKLASLLATDPPYLVDYTGGDHPPTRANKGKANRNKNRDEHKDPDASVEFFARFLQEGLKHLAKSAPSTNGTRPATRHWWSKPGSNAGSWSTRPSCGPRPAGS